MRRRALLLLNAPRAASPVRNERARTAWGSLPFWGFVGVCHTLAATSAEMVFGARNALGFVHCEGERGRDCLMVSQRRMKKWAPRVDVADRLVVM